MKNLKIIVFINLLIFLLFTNLFSTEIDIVNSPTAEVIDYGTGEISVRIYSYGGLISRFIFAPFNRINFGGSIDIEKFVGYETPEVHDPSFYMKWRIFDGTKVFPAVAIGYDGQGYKFVSTKYSLPAKGLFLVFSQNVVAKKMFIDIGINFTKYDESSKLLSFVSIRGSIEDIIKLGVEYENINEQKIQQVNLLFKLCLSELINVDFIFVNVIDRDTKIERQVRIGYLYKFF
jgi:hypothetical protein